ncbi:inorganic phosphate transporter [Paracoccus ravus]|uniref:inorganic phosphate transporter n=1 Tax=Paracoccus ravus TaxID=2447760 RepID=UPI00106E3B46|nr:inorganic phosphate transporter [Paracoccus ravus]
MAQNPRDYRTLDKDLRRITTAEHASLASARPMVRVGFALVFIAAVAEFAAAAMAGQPALGIMAASVAIAIYLAVSIGSNDVANALGPAVGAGAISLTLGLFLVAIMDVLGAVLAGEAVTRTMTEGLVAQTLGHGHPTALMMLAALAAAATCISLATALNATVSTTHSVVGAIAGAGIASFGWASVNWTSFGSIALGWVISPILSGLLSAALLASMHRHVLDKEDPIPSGRLWLTILVAVVVALAVCMGAAAFRGVSGPMIAALGLTGALLGGLYAHVTLARQIGSGEKVALKRLLGLPLIVAAMVMGFGHGANDTSNIAAPLTIILMNIDETREQILNPTLVLLLSGLGIAVGTLLFGGKLVNMVGSKITRLNPPRSLCIAIATAVTVLGFSLAGLPVSTTHVSVGGVFGVGFYREWRDRNRHRESASMPDEELYRRHLVRRSHVRTILGAWLITVPVNAGVAAVLVMLLRL